MDLQYLIIAAVFSVGVFVLSLWGVLRDRGSQPSSPDERRPAGLCVRLSARMVDLIVVNAASAVALIAASIIEALGLISVWVWGLALAFIVVFAIVYFTIPTARSGQTPGKRLAGVVVERETGERLSVGRSLVRSLVDVASLGLTIVWIGYLDYLPIGVTSGKRAIHDGIAGSFARRIPRPVSFHLVWLAALGALVPFVLVFWVIRPHVAHAFYVPSASMSPTLVKKDRFLANGMAYKVGSVHRGDIIVFEAPPSASSDGRSHDFTKRVIGIPGDVVEVRAGYVSVNDLALSHYDLREALSERDTHGAVNVRITSNCLYVNGKKIALDAVASAVGMPSGEVHSHPGCVLRNGKVVEEPYIDEDADTDFGPVKVPPGTVFVMGDNRNNSADSRMWGPVPITRIKGKATLRFWPPERIGIVR